MRRLLHVAVAAATVSLACSPKSASDRLARAFPAQAERILAGERFATTRTGYAAPAAPLASSRVDAIAAALAARDGLRVDLPRSGRDPVVLAHGSLRVELHELGAPRRDGVEGKGAIAYEGPSSTSYWTATADGYEQWLLVDDARSGPVAEWDVRGGTLRARIDGVDVLDAAGTARLHVAAPAAFRADGTPARAWLTVAGNRLALHTEARGVALVDPLWTAVGSVAGARGFHTATSLGDGTLLVAGGYGSGTTGPLASAALYDPATQAWTTVGGMTTARYDHTATLLPNGKVLVAGGLGASGYLASTELFDPATATWSGGPPMTRVRSHHTATLLPDGRVLVAGGTDGGASRVGTLATSEIYDPVANAWTAALPMRSPRAGHAAALLPNATVLVSGGEDVSPLGTAEIFDPAAGTWTLTGSLSAFRTEHSQTVLPTGAVLVAGGWDGGEAFATAELYDPGTGTWTATGALGVARRYHVATLLPSGEVLVTGGDDGAGPLASAELYDPVSGTWAATDPLSTPRYYHTATLLPGGDVIVAFGANTAFVASAERYQPPASTPSWRPSIAPHPAPVSAGGPITLSGTLISGVSEGSSGRTQASASNAPSVRVARLDDTFLRLCPATAFSAASVTAVVPASAAPGAYWVSVIANGVESDRTRVDVLAQLLISPDGAATFPRGTIPFDASGGASPYTWSVPTNSSGATITADGFYTAGATPSTIDVVQVTDAYGNPRTVRVTVGPGVSVSPAVASAEPGGTIAFAASGGSGTGYAWTLSASASGGSIDGLTGAYTAGATGDVTDVVHVADSAGNEATVNVSVIPLGGSLSISPPTATVTPGASVAFAAAGGTSPYAWSVRSNASGAAITQAGVYRAGATGGVADFVRVTDANGVWREAIVTVTGGLAIAPATASTPPRGTITFAATGGSGAGYAWILATNASGGSITSAGVYRAGSTGDVTDVVRVTDSLGNAATRDVAVGPGVSILPPASTRVETGASVTLQATGGNGAYTWSLAVNASGGSVSSGGTYTAGATPGVVDTVQVVDGLGNAASIELSVVPPPPPLEISPATSTAAPGGTIAFTASGGSGMGYAWSLVQNESGGSIEGTTGVYTAGPTAGTDTIRLVDSAGNAAFRDVVVGTPPPLIDISPAVASIEAGGTLTFAASGGTGTGYTWSMTLAPSGGSITASGVYTAGATWGVADVVRVQDSAGNAATREVTVTQPVLPLAVSPATASAPPRGTISFSATGGAGGYSWSLAASPSGGTITAAGVYTAGPTGSVTDVVRVTDANGTSATRNVSVTAGVTISPATATVGHGGSIAFTATGGSGTGYAWSLATNASGGSISSTGAYTAGSTAGVTDVVRVVDSLGNEATRNVSVTTAPPIVIAPASIQLAPGASVPFGATGGTGTGYTWSLATNASGGSITAQGFYTAGQTAGVDDVVQVMDSGGATATATVQVRAPSGGGGGGGGGCASGGGGGWLSLALLFVADLRRRRAVRPVRPAPGR